MKRYIASITAALCVPLLGISQATPKFTSRDNASVFQKLHKGVNMDTSLPDNGVWPKIQHDVEQFRAAADAGFESVRVFLPFRSGKANTEQQIKDALSNNLAMHRSTHPR